MSLHARPGGDPDGRATTGSSSGPATGRTSDPGPGIDAAGHPPPVVAGQAATLPPEAAQVLRQFRIIFNAVRSHQQQVERRAGVTGAQVWALQAIAEAPGLGVTGLASAMDVRQPTASILVKALVQQGLARADRDSADRRSSRLWLTAAGQAVLAQAPGPSAGVLPQALLALDSPALRQLGQGLDRLITSLQADPAGAQVPLSPLKPQPPPPGD